MNEKEGFVSLEDLKAYEAKLRPPVHTTFRGSEIYSIGPPSSGGIVLCQMLNILERFDLRKDGRESPVTLHRVTEAMRRAYFTRADKLGDPDFVKIPVDELTSKAYADQLASSIGEPRHAEPGARTLSDRDRRRRPHDTSLGHRPGGQRRRADLHPRRLLRSEVRRRGRRLPAQQRDG